MSKTLVVPGSVDCSLGRLDLGWIKSIFKEIYKVYRHSKNCSLGALIFIIY